VSNVLLNAGSGGATLGTDTVTGTPNVDYQIVKLSISAAGVAPTTVSASNPMPANLAQISGTAASVNSGVKDAGTLRVVIATDQPSLTNAQPVSQSGTWSVNLGTLNGVALDTSVNGLLVAQASTTSGQKGPLVQGAVTTAAPTYTTAQTDPLSLTTSGALRVDIGATSANATAIKVDGSAVTQPVSGTVTTSPPANASTNIAQINGVTPLMGNGTTGTGSLRVTISSDNTAFSVNAVQSGTWTVQPGNTANTTPWLTTNVPGTSPGSTQSRVKAAASTNATSLKASAGVVLGYALYNNTSSAKFFKFYNKASAPTVGTDTPAFTIIIPASGGANVEFSSGIPFGTGIAYAITGAVTDADTTATAADDVHGVVLWK
jgi:hypothetical protein